MRSVRLSVLFLILAVGLVGFKWQTKGQYAESLPHSINSNVKDGGANSLSQQKVGEEAQKSIQDSSASNHASFGKVPKEISDELQKIITGEINPPDILGVTIQIVSPKWTWNSAAGNANINPVTPATASMRFRIASVSKMFTAVAICKLVDEGKLNLDDSCDKWLPKKYLDRMANHSQITLRLMLQHRSGIADYDEMGSLIPLQISQPDTPVITDFSIFQGLDKGPLYAPNAGYTYSNVNYLLLTRVIDAASGMSYEKYINKKIIKFLKLKNTFTTTEPPINYIPGSHMSCIADPYGTGTYTDYTTMYVCWDSGAGDIISNAADLNTFHMALRSGRLISSRMFNEMSRFLSTGTENSAYGFAYQNVYSSSVNANYQGHSGGYPGSTTYVLIWVEKDIYFGVNVNGNGKNLTLTPIVQYLQQKI